MPLQCLRNQTVWKNLSSRLEATAERLADSARDAVLGANACIVIRVIMID